MIEPTEEVRARILKMLDVRAQLRSGVRDKAVTPEERVESAITVILQMADSDHGREVVAELLFGNE